MTVTHEPAESLAERYDRLARETPGRARVDLTIRALDVTLSTIFLLLLLPVSVPIALAILLTSGTPVLYRGERVGRGGRVYTMMKVRTLRPGAEGRVGP